MHWYAYAGVVPADVVVFAAGILVTSAVVVALVGCGALLALVLLAQRDRTVKAPPVCVRLARDGEIRRAA